LNNGKHGLTEGKVGADGLAENTQNAPEFICPIGLPILHYVPLSQAHYFYSFKALYDASYKVSQLCAAWADIYFVILHHVPISQAQYFYSFKN
jgi:hypothetical protein